MLELEGVRSGYGKLEILQSASLRVPDGAIVGIIGPNGAGKSTLLKTAFGYLAPWAGRIALDGRQIAGRRPDEIMRCGVGYLAQAGGLFAEMTVHDNLVLGGYTVSRAEKRRAIDSVYARFPLFRDRRRQLAARCPGASSACSPSPAPSSSTRACCCWTSRRPRWRHASSTRSMRRSWRSTATGSPC